MAYTKIYYSTRSVLFSILLVTILFLLSSCDFNEGSIGSANNLLKITAVSPDSGFVGAAVQISGSGFVPQASGNKIIFGGGVLAVVQPAGPRSLLAHVPKGAQSGRVKLTVAGQTVTGPYFKVLTHGPSISSVSPLKGPAGTQITILGDHFLPGAAAGMADSSGVPQQVTGIPDSLLSNRPSLGEVSGTARMTLPATHITIPSSSSKSNGQRSSKMTITVSVGGVLTPILSISGTKIIIEIPEGAGNGPIIVTVGGQSDSWTNFQVIAAPVITSMTPKQGPAGITVTLKGTGFSSTPDSNTVTFNSTKATIQSASTTKLVAMVPSGATSGLVKVQANGQTAAGPTFTVTAKPANPANQLAIADISPKEGPIGTTISINGKNFSTDKTKNTVTFNGTKATVTSASKTKLVVKIPSGATSGLVKVAANGQTAAGPTFTVTADPADQLTITDISPKSGPVGTSVTITGKNFSTTKTDNNVTFNGTSAKVNSASATTLVVNVPSGATTGPVKVATNGQTAAGPTFTVTAKPANPANQLAIADISPKEGPIGTTVSISGKNFSTDKTKNTVTFNGTKATVTSASKTKLVVKVPSGATSGLVKVAANGQTAAGPTFTVTKASVPQVTITNVTPKNGPIGTTVTITGTNFSTTKADNVVTFNGTPATVSSATTTTLSVSIPAGATTGSVKVTIGSQTATGPTFMVVLNPPDILKITGISPKEGVIGSPVTITGRNFSTNKANDIVKFGAKTATVNSASATQLKITVPGGLIQGQSYNVTVLANGQTSNPVIFKVKRVFFLGANGITVKCPDAAFGASGTVKGVTYTKRKASGITPANASTTCTSGITDMSNMFTSTFSFNGDISTWDVSSVTDMSAMFYRATSFNGDISGWDVSSVTDMTNMFYIATSFDQDISGWDVSSVTDMSHMFAEAHFFNRDLSGWDVSSVTHMINMFNGAGSFNGDISGWCVPHISSLPIAFATGSPIQGTPKLPVWGTCPATP